MIAGLLTIVLFILPSARAGTQAQANPEMTTYQFVFFRGAPNKAVPPSEAQKMQASHLEGLIKLNTARVNLLFGPFLDGGDLRGIAVLDVPSADAARQALADDPFVKGGYMTVDVKPWYAPKGWFHLPEPPHTPENLVLGFLMRGSNTQQPAAEGAKIQAAHLAYMDELHKQGKLIAAGPFGDNSEWRGLVIYRVGSVEAAKELAAGDPAVKAGRLVIDARPWMTFKGILK